MSNSNGEYRLHSFVPASGDWVSIHAVPEAPDGADPWTAETIIGWAAVLRPDLDFEIVPVIGGEYIEIDGDSLGVYPRGDLIRPDVRQAIEDICNKVRENHRARTLHGA
jgi:hypothetical protein